MRLRRLCFIWSKGTFSYEAFSEKKVLIFFQMFLVGKNGSRVLCVFLWVFFSTVNFHCSIFLRVKNFVVLNLERGADFGHSWLGKFDMKFSDMVFEETCKAYFEERLSSYFCMNKLFRFSLFSAPATYCAGEEKI